MNRLLFVAAILAIITVTFVPTFDALFPHHDDAAAPHSAQDNECGCICHLAVDAVSKTLTLEIYLTNASAEVAYDYSLPDPPPKSINRPPEMFS